MSNKEVISKIKRCDTMQLLTFIINNPEYLTDSYFNVFGNAIEERYKELKDER